MEQLTWGVHICTVTGIFSPRFLLFWEYAGSKNNTILLLEQNSSYLKHIEIRSHGTIFPDAILVCVWNKVWVKMRAGDKIR